MSLQYRKRVKVVNGLWLHVSSDSLCPTFEIAGAGVRKLNRRGMEADEISIKDLQDIFSHIDKMRVALSSELTQRQETLNSQRKRSKWLQPILSLFFQRKATTRLDQMESQEVLQFEEVQAKLDALGLRFEWIMSSDIAQKYDTVLHTFSDVRLSEVIWNITGSSPVDQFTERSNARRAVDRCPVRFYKGKPRCLLISDGDPYASVPQLPNGNGEVLYVFPGVVVLEGPTSLKVLSIKDLTITAGTTRFIETDALPSDASIAGYSWLRENKDGSPDRRFIDNYQIPKARYGEVRFKGWGLDEEYQFSSKGYGLSFGRSLEALKRSIVWADQNPSQSISESDYQH
ncbi:hypothetical protein [Pseudomonas sp. NPDC087336]|uniref:hypothetical protein n=1 Tax=Pseudomonas sp. NPDC087336 TaxID=3364436 RepID=UPI0037FFF85A